MKKISTLLMLLFATLTFFAQNECKELFITEIVFGQDGSYSIEVFNPSDQPIDLSNYKLQLLGDGADDVNIVFSGIVDVFSTYVITKIGSSAPIETVSDVLTLLLDFEGKSVVQLVKNDTEILDKFGNMVETTTTFDLTEFLNNPFYVDGLEIDLGLISSLLIRRKGAIQEGKVDFENSDFLDQWKIFPDFMIQDLGEHKNACISPILNWANVSWWDPELVIDENDPWAIYGDIEVSGYLDYDVTVYISETSPQFSGYDEAYSNLANCGFDFWCPDWTYNIPAGGSGLVPIQISAGIMDDYDYEGNEGVGLMLWMDNDNGTGTTIGFDNLWDMVIIDNEPNSIDDFSINSSITLFPTVIDDHFDVKVDDANVIIENVILYSTEGKMVKPQILNNTIYINDSFSAGYYTVFIYTNRGIATKRIIKK